MTRKQTIEERAEEWAWDKAEEIAKRGDYFVRDVVGEYTFFLVDEESHGLIYGAATDK